jgi:hypothetical protein
MSDNLERSLGRVEGQLVSMEKSFHEKLDTLLELHRTSDQKHDRSDTRLSHLEKWQARVIGAYAALVLIIGIVLKVAL